MIVAIVTVLSVFYCIGLFLTLVLSTLDTRSNQSVWEYILWPLYATGILKVDGP